MNLFPKKVEYPFKPHAVNASCILRDYEMPYSTASGSTMLPPWKHILQIKENV